MSARATLGVGEVGMGFMGQTHVRAWSALERRGLGCLLVAVCDKRVERLDGRVDVAGNLGAKSERKSLFDPKCVHTSARVDELLADPAVSIVSICTPTPTHVELACRALAAGKHVLVEKPLALRAAEIEPLRVAARNARTLCMPGLCMRFWPGWDWLRETIVSKKFGSVRSAVFQRLGSQPGWSTFYADEQQSGGALIDLHVHDADFVRWCFGEPSEVVSQGDARHVTTLYRFEHGPGHVSAEGAWDLGSGLGFRMRFTVVFEQASVDFDLSRTPRLMLVRGADVSAPELVGDAYELQAEHFLRAALGEEETLRATVEDGYAVARLLDLERESLARHAAVKVGG